MVSFSTNVFPRMFQEPRTSLTFSLFFRAWIKILKPKKTPKKNKIQIHILAYFNRVSYISAPCKHIFHTFLEQRQSCKPVPKTSSPPSKFLLSTSKPFILRPVPLLPSKGWNFDGARSRLLSERIPLRRNSAGRSSVSIDLRIRVLFWIGKS